MKQRTLWVAAALFAVVACSEVVMEEPMVMEEPVVMAEPAGIDPPAESKPATGSGAEPDPAPETDPGDGGTIPWPHGQSGNGHSGWGMNGQNSAGSNLVICAIRPHYCTGDPSVLYDPAVFQDVVGLYQTGQISEPEFYYLLSILQPATASIDPSAGEADFPELLPWPPPRASRRLRLDKELLWAELNDKRDIGDVADFLASEMIARDYDQVGFLGVPGDGFAMLTGLEQIDDQAMPLEGPDRWVEDIVVKRDFSIGAFLDALLSAPEGNYRVFVFVFTDLPFQENPDETISTELLQEWSGRSVVDLPEALALTEASDRHELTVLVYEFVKQANDQAAELRLPGAWNAREHLKFSGLERFVN